jgi:hypothetical protein
MAIEQAVLKHRLRAFLFPQVTPVSDRVGSHESDSGYERRERKREFRRRQLEPDAGDYENGRHGHSQQRDDSRVASTESERPPQV